jgi:maleate isomerase
MIDIIETPKPDLDSRPLRKRVGLITLATDHTSEPDLNRMLGPLGFGIYSNRIRFANPITREGLLGMAPDIAQAAELILPGEDLDAVVYGCTAASVAIGDEAIVAAVQSAKPGVPVVTPTASAVAALRSLNAIRISVLSPNDCNASQALAEFFEAQGFDILRFTCLGMVDDGEIARVATPEIVRLAKQAVAPGSDALFISCTALRAAMALPDIEAALDVPVVSSNYAVAWDLLRVAGMSGNGAGRLMQTLP